jgi:ABC-2 type transport system ATP-binding protein
MQSESEGFVDVQGVTKRYKQFMALDDVRFNVRKGEIFGYIGPNGAGKTTTIKVMVGLLRDFEGDVRISGHSIRENGNEIHRLLGYLPQKAAFQEWRTVDHALTTFGRLSGLGENEIDRRIKDVLDVVGIREARHKRIVQLSGGTVQKVGLAQAIIHQPELLILDEPMAGLDPESRYMFKNLFRELARKNGTTVLLSSHILSDLQDVGDRIGILNGGRLMHIGTVEDLRRRLQMATEIDLVLSATDRTVPNLDGIDGIDHVKELGPNAFRIFLTDSKLLDDVTNQILNTMLKTKCRVRSVNPVSPSLEELYMKFLGGGAG